MPLVRSGTPPCCHSWGAGAVGQGSRLAPTGQPCGPPLGAGEALEVAPPRCRAGSIRCSGRGPATFKRTVFPLIACSTPAASCAPAHTLLTRHDRRTCWAGGHAAGHKAWQPARLTQAGAAAQHCKRLQINYNRFEGKQKATPAQWRCQLAREKQKTVRRRVQVEIRSQELRWCTSRFEKSWGAPLEGLVKRERDTKRKTRKMRTPWQAPASKTATATEAAQKAAPKRMHFCKALMTKSSLKQYTAQRY